MILDFVPFLYHLKYLEFTIMKKVSLLLSSLLLIGFAAVAQVMPQASPKCMEMRTVGFTEVTLEYSSPGVKGRKIWGDLVPFDQAWRAGANAATKITFGTAVKIGDKAVRAGSYSVFVTPTASGDWTVHISTAGSVYEHMDRETGKIDMEALAKKDVATASVKATDLPAVQERLTYDLEQAENGMLAVSMSWEKKSIRFMVDTNPNGLMEQMEKNLKAGM